MDRLQLRRELAGLIASASDGAVRAEDVLTADCALAALGVTSLTQIRLIDAIEETFGVYVDLEDGISMMDTLDSLTEYVGTHEPQETANAG